MSFTRIIGCLVAPLFFISCKEVVLNAESNEVIEIFQGDTDFNFLPTSTTNNVYHHDAFAFSYAEEYEQSEWVAYYLDSNDMSSVDFERPYFNQDPIVITKSADWRNFKKSGYNKGHLCPAADRKSSYELYEQTFFTSNVSPQLYDFNAGIWNRMEQKVRYWAKRYDGVYVLTGGVLSDNLKTIGKEKVAVPNYFYKIVLTKDRSKMIGFLVPHQKTSKAIYEFVVSVDTIEQMTGIDFFPNLEDALETKLESVSNVKF
ncbi:DNA/RNA non-specific endonuclease [Flavobacterium chuncheonense]|uniref:DNA/RNA non-specific endonuclease n=1 Tax=Flavobacterium chuncheonense TaxID=2026653 RepID=A0ABW5YND9_9FLAO